MAFSFYFHLRLTHKWFQLQFFPIWFSHFRQEVSFLTNCMTNYQANYQANYRADRSNKPSRIESLGSKIILTVDELKETRASCSPARFVFLFEQQLELSFSSKEP